MADFATVSPKAMKGRTYNVGSKNGALLAKQEVGTKLTMTVYELQELEPETNFDGSPYTGDPLLYLICEYEGKKGYRIKVNDMECVEFIIGKGKLDFDIDVEVDTFTDSKTNKERKRFDLVSWN